MIDIYDRRALNMQRRRVGRVFVLRARYIYRAASGGMRYGGVNGWVP